MAPPALPSPSPLPPELRATKGALDQRWLELNGLIATVLEVELDPRRLRVETDYHSNGVWAGLQGAACERVTRNHGGATWVAPLCEMPNNLVAWLGWQEVWAITTGPKPYRFKTMGLTVYLGRRHDALKLQFLRLEWPGIADWSSGALSFQSPGAGHPHWQIDLMQSLASSRPPADFEPDAAEVVEDFEAMGQEPAVDDLVRRLSVERMHLASAARWWLPAAHGDVGHHMNAPPDLQSLSRWLRESLLYLKQELRRCVVHV